MPNPNTIREAPGTSPILPESKGVLVKNQGNSDHYGGAGGVGYSTRAEALASIKKAGAGSEQVNPGINPVNPETPTQPTTSYTGNSIVDALNQAGQKSDINARATLAGQLGVPYDVSATGQASATQNTSLLDKYRQTHQNLQISGAPASNTPGIGLGAVKDSQPPAPVQVPENPLDSIFLNDPNVQASLAQRKEMTDYFNQQTSLVDEYKKMVKDSGLDEINAQLMNVGNIIDGTEDDIRTEVSKVAGFATDSQVLALANARNKVLIKNYNNLLQTKQQITDNINTMVGLSKEDRAYALQKMNTLMNIDQQTADFKSKAITNAQNSYAKTAEAIGWDGVLKSAMATGDPKAIQRINATMGNGFDLATVASQPNLDRQIKQAQLANINSEIAARNKDALGKIVKINGQDYIQNKDGSFSLPNVPSNQGQTMGSKDTIDTINNLLNDKGMKTAVGTSALFGRGGLSGLFAGSKKQQFIAGVQQLTSNLTLTALEQAKQNGATFGALSEGELGLLSGSATKLNQYAKIKKGKVIGYNVNEKGFKKELDNISNFAKRDYILKGGSPEDVGAVPQADGTVWSKNSDGSYTKIK